MANSIMTVYEIKSDEKELIRGVLKSGCEKAGSLALDDGIYVGGISGGRPSGYGKAVYGDGTRYTGLWQDGVKHGGGVFLKADGSSEEQTWENGARACGSSVINYSDGTYTGEISNGLPNGKGVRIWSNGSSYDGDWVNGVKHGRGKFVYPDKSCYDGEWKDDLKHGSGRFIRDDGSAYRGDWEGGRLVSRSEESPVPEKAVKPEPSAINYSDGTYKGEISNGLPHGKGIRVWSDGSVFDGKWSNGRRDGYGVFKYSDGSSYEGMWKDDLKHGRGKFTRPDGSFFVGEWDNGVKTSSSAQEQTAKAAEAPETGYDPNLHIIHYPDGYYRGEAQNGLPHGKGSRIWNSGDFYEGEWVNGKREGYGTLTLANRTKYEGMWSDDKKNGTGKFTFTDGTFAAGTWKDDVRVMPAGAAAETPAPTPDPAPVPAPVPAQNSVDAAAESGLMGSMRTNDTMTVRGLKMPVYAFGGGGFYSGSLYNGKRNDGIDVHKDSIGQYVASEYRNGAEVGYDKINVKKKGLLVFLTLLFGGLGYLFYMKPRVYQFHVGLYIAWSIGCFGLLCNVVTDEDAVIFLFATAILLIANFVYFIKALKKPSKIYMYNKKILPPELIKYLT